VGVPEYQGTLDPKMESTPAVGHKLIKGLIIGTCTVTSVKRFTGEVDESNRPDQDLWHHGYVMTQSDSSLM